MKKKTDEIIQDEYPIVSYHPKYISYIPKVNKIYSFVTAIYWSL